MIAPRNSIEPQSGEPLPNSTRAYVPGKIHPDVRVPFREIKLSPTRTFNGQLETNPPLRVYECLSDDGARWNTYATSALQDVITCYQDIGTSYDQVSTWVYFCQYVEGLSGAALHKRQWQIMNRYVPIMRKKGASRAVLIYEDTADFALSTGLMDSNGFPQNYRVMGWHNRYDWASMSFLDGHSAYVNVDWRYVRPGRMSPTAKGYTATWVTHHDVGDN